MESKELATRGSAGPRFRFRFHSSRELSGLSASAFSLGDFVER